DVYALGLLLYEMLTGRHPFEGLRGDGLLDAHLSTPPPPLPATAALSPPLRQLIEQCLAKHPRLRPRDGAEFRERLRRAQGLPDDMPDESDVDRSLRETSPGHDTRATLPSTLSLAHLRARLQPERRGRMRWGAAAAAIAAGLWLWQRPTDPPLVAQPFVPPPPSLLDTSELPSEASSPSAAPREPAVDVLFHTIPDGAILRIDGHERGRTPQSISLPKGRVAKVELMLPGHVSRTLDLLPTENTRIRHVFVVAGTKPDPVNAKVDRYLD
ncbi:MAG: PEGA domain-containing protein, partial [Myxococcales bacterium]|nr:PEGA domain-containing protein [Myxococcales bacterium]